MGDNISVCFPVNQVPSKRGLLSILHFFKEFIPNFSNKKLIKASTWYQLFATNFSQNCFVSLLKENNSLPKLDHYWLKCHFRRKRKQCTVLLIQFQGEIFLRHRKCLEKVSREILRFSYLEKSSCNQEVLKKYNEQVLCYNIRSLSIDTCTTIHSLHFGYIKRKNAFEHGQTQIILCIYKVLSGTLLFIHTFCSIQRFC